MPNGKSPTVKRELVTDKMAFAFYRENAKNRNVKNTNHISKYSKIVKAFYSKVGDKLVEKKGGVFLPGFGYFVVLLNPIKRVVDSAYKDNQMILINAHSNSRTYHPAFLNVSVDLSMKSFTMDKFFSRSVKKRLGQQIKAGVKYRNHFGLLLSIFKNKKR